jgi:hypothetical protein
MPADHSDAALLAEWAAAQAKLGVPFANAGKPDIQQLPAACDPHLQQVRQTFQLPAAQFALIEIDPLLAFQFAVDRGRAEQHCGTLPNPPPTDDLLRVCLPAAHTQEDVQLSNAGASMVIKSRNTNMRILAGGLFQTEQRIGVQFGFSLPLVHVVRWQGLSFLHNGFHRAIGCRAAGATHMPCIVRDVASPQEVGINPPNTFDAALLQSGNPPTVGHFTQGRAYDVQLRAMTRIIHVSWAEHIMPNE